MNTKGKKGKSPETQKPTPKGDGDKVKENMGKVLDKMFGPKKGDGSNRA